MLPYAIFMMKFIWSDHALDVRGIDPVPGGVSFRLSKTRAEELFTAPASVQCLFLDYGTKCYHRVCLSSGEFHIALAESTESKDVSPYFSLFHLTSDSPDFQKHLKALIRDYTDYIHLKLENEELEAMDQMTGHTLGSDYPSSLSDWQKTQRKQTNWNVPLKLTQLAVCLDSLDFMRAFLQMDFPDFIAYYWNQNGLADHPIAHQRITHVYIGNLFCPLLSPEIPALERLLVRSCAIGLKPVVVFSTMPEHLIPAFREKILYLLNRTQQSGRDLEIVINDFGTALLIREIIENTDLNSSGGSSFSLTLGPLLCKRVKDVRLAWINPQTAREDMTTADAGFYQAYLKDRLHIDAISYEASGYPIRISGMGQILHLPLYQMNTSGFCTLYAMCRNHNRGAQEEVHSCPHYCEEKQVFYPSGLPTIGRFNSLFGCCMEELDNVNKLNSYIDRGIRRLVVRM